MLSILMLGKMEPEQPMIVTGSRDSTLRVWKLPDPRKDDHFNTPTAPGANGSNSPTPDDSVHNPYFLHVLNGHTQSVRAIAGHGNVLVSGSYDHTVRVWDLNHGSNVFCFRGHTEKVYSVGYSHELRRAASGSMDATVRVWCTRTGVCLHVLKGNVLIHCSFCQRVIVRWWACWNFHPLIWYPLLPMPLSECGRRRQENVVPPLRVTLLP
jgi:WD40 repeat protein